MAYPIQLQIFTTFMGTQEGIHSVALPAIFSSSGSRNLWIDKLGRAKKILGYTKKNSSAVTTNTGGSATRLTALRAFRKTVGVDPRQVLGLFDDGSDEVELFYSANDGETWTFIHDFGSEEVGIRPDFAQVDDVLYITLGNAEAPRTWNGSALGTAGPTIRSPAPSGSAGSTLGQLNGSYTWKLVSVDGTETRVAGSTTSGVVQVENKSVTVSWTADSDTDITGYELYRTTGTGTTFYFVSFISGRTTTSYVDNNSDLDILANRTLEEHGDAPPSGTYFVEPHKQRLWWGRTNANPRRVQWSDPGQPDQVGDNNYLDFTDESHGSIGDVITGLSGDYDGMLVVFQEQSIWTVSGSGQIANSVMDWRRTRTNAIAGTVSHNSVVTVPAGAIYTDTSGKSASVGKNVLAYFTPLGDIRLFDGNNDTIISTAVKTTLSQFAYEYRKKVHAIHDIERGHVVWFFPGRARAAEDARECTRAVVWNYRWGVWYEWPNMPLASATTLENVSDAQLILAGEAQTSKGGYCYEFFTGDSFDGENIPARWLTKVLYGQDGQQPLMAYNKRWRWLDFIAEADADVTLTVEWMSGDSSDEAVSRGAAARALVPVGLALITADAGRLVTANSTAADRTPIVSHHESAHRIIKLQSSNGYYVEDVGMRVRISDDSTDGSWSLEGMTLGYQMLPGASRRMQG
tara:strand:- start:488 stop:2548 length:2061 start_codon:yes stop_codon:yes gene_type:complete